MLRIPAALGAVALSLALAGSAVAADTSSTTTKGKSAKKSGHHKRGGAAGGKAAPTRTALTGDVKAQAEAAALVAVPGTVEGSWVAHACPRSTTTSAMIRPAPGSIGTSPCRPPNTGICRPGSRPLAARRSDHHLPTGSRQTNCAPAATFLANWSARLA